jgi:hypothetical protein
MPVGVYELPAVLDWAQRLEGSFTVTITTTEDEIYIVRGPYASAKEKLAAVSHELGPGKIRSIHVVRGSDSPAGKPRR